MQKSPTVGKFHGDSVHFRAGEFDHLGPLVGLGRKKPGKIGGRAGQWRATQLSNPRLLVRVGKGGVEFLIVSTMAAGVPAGTAMPYHGLAS